MLKKKQDDLLIGWMHYERKKRLKDNSKYHTIALILHTSEVTLKSSKLGLNSMWTKNFQMYKLDLEKAEEPEIKLSTSLDHRKC